MSAPATILVVEDNGANQLLATAVLERAGYLVLIAESAVEALERLRSCAPDLILMDVQLPGQDGLSLTRQLKADTRTANIPIIALTAHAMKGDREQAIEAGCSGYIKKPIDTRTLAGQIGEFLAGTKVGS